MGLSVSCNDYHLTLLATNPPAGGVACQPDWAQAQIPPPDLNERLQELCLDPVVSPTKTLIEWRPSGKDPAAFVSGDFDGDGLTDLAVGLPNCNYHNFRGPPGMVLPPGAIVRPDAGAVFVFRGVAPGGASPSCLSQEPPIEVRDPAGIQNGARFGTALAALPWGVNPGTPTWDGDYLVVGVPGFLDSVHDVKSGSVRGLAMNDQAPHNVAQWWRLDSFAAEVPLNLDLDGAEFGASLAVGEFNHDPTMAELAVGAPRLPLVDALAVVHAEVGAVEVFDGDSTALTFVPSGLPTAVQEDPPFFHHSALHRPMPVCNHAAYVGWQDGTGAACLDGSGDICDGARFGTALAAGRFFEDSNRSLAIDLAVGAPGSAGGAGVPGSGHVEVLDGSGLTPASPLSTIVYETVGDDCAKDRYLDPTRSRQSGLAPNAWLTGAQVAPSDYEPEPEDHYGRALFATDLVRTIFADHHLGPEDMWKDELLIGAPGEDALACGAGLCNTPAAVEVQDAGMFCVWLGADEDAADLVGVADLAGLSPNDEGQWCFSIVERPDTKPGGWAIGAAAGAHLGASLVGGRLAAWDPDVQIFVGAPGDPTAADPSIKHGTVYGFHFHQIFNEGLLLADPEVGINGRVVWWDSFTVPSRNTAHAPRRPGGFGATVARADVFCGDSTSDVLVSGPQTFLSTTDPADDVVDGVWMMGWAPNLNSDWEGMYEGTANSSLGPQNIQVFPAFWDVAIGAPPGGVVELWSPDNFAVEIEVDLAALVFDLISDNIENTLLLQGYSPADAAALRDLLLGAVVTHFPADSSDVATFCVAVPFNLLSQQGGVPYDADLGPASLPGPCAATGWGSPEVAWSLPEGLGWFEFGPPASQVPEPGAATLLAWDGTEMPAVGSVDVGSQLSSLTGSPIDLWLDYSLSQPVAGEIDLCARVDSSVVPDPSIRINGETSGPCPASSAPGDRHWLLLKEKSLSCAMGWRP